MQLLRVLHERVVRGRQPGKVDAKRRRGELAGQESLHEGHGAGRADGGLVIAVVLVIVHLVLEHGYGAPPHVHRHQQGHGVLQDQLLAKAVRRVALQQWRPGRG